MDLQGFQLVWTVFLEILFHFFLEEHLPNMYLVSRFGMLLLSLIETKHQHHYKLWYHTDLGYHAKQDDNKH